VFALTFENWENLKKKDRKLRLLLVQEDLLRKLWNTKDAGSVPLHEIYGTRNEWMRDRIITLRKLGEHYFGEIEKIEQTTHANRKTRYYQLCVGSVVLTSLDENPTVAERD